ncbi:MAG: imidazolonepropionase [Melioribacteraceae bacterium]
MQILFKNPAQIVTVNTNGINYKRGKDTSELDVLKAHSILVENGIIKKIIPNKNLDKVIVDKEIDLTSKIILPGIVECHTHTVFAGTRAKEFRKRLSGTSYEKITKSGGGINTTVKAVRNSSFEELIEIAEPKINEFITQGVTTLEIKSGYGLSYYDEIKLLQVINHLNLNCSIDIIPTFLGAHTFPPEYANDKDQYIKILTDELIPYIAENKLAKSCDAFCEATAFSAKQIDKIFEVAKNNGLDIKLHTEQFNSVGGLDVALKHNAKSVDHLEVLGDAGIAKLSNSDTVAVLLPGVSYFLQYSFAPGRKLIDNNSIVALATDYNPGSSHISNISMIMSLAAFKMNMTTEEIISAYTINSAKALGVSNSVGSIEVGKVADFSIYNTSGYSDIIYNVGKNLNCLTVKNGEVIYRKITEQ